jgi:Flp pilus assembly protein TadB
MQPSEWKTSREIEDLLRTKDPDLDRFLAGPSTFRRPWIMICAVYVVCPVLIVVGVGLDVIPLVVAAVLAAPLIPVTAWLLDRRRSR